jgi:hypothetical protein
VNEAKATWQWLDENVFTPTDATLAAQARAVVAGARVSYLAQLDAKFGGGCTRELRRRRRSGARRAEGNRGMNPMVAPPRDLVVEALALVKLMSPSEYVTFVESLYGAGVPRS